MYETYQLLFRLREHFGYDCSVVVGICETIICVSVSWGEFTTFFDITEEVLKSSISSELIEQLAVQHIENSHKLWEVGEI